MSDRLQALQRILALQTRLVEIAGWKLAAAERAKADAGADLARLQTFVATDHPSGTFAFLASRTMVRLAARRTAADHRADESAASKRRVEVRLRLAERFVAARQSEERDADERRRLEELADVMGQDHRETSPR